MKLNWKRLKKVYFAVLLLDNMLLWYVSISLIALLPYWSARNFFGFVRRPVTRPINRRKARRLHCRRYLHYIKSERDLPLLQRVGIHRFTEVNGYPTNSLKCSTSKCAYESCPSVNLFLRSTSPTLLVLRLNRRLDAFAGFDIPRW